MATNASLRLDLKQPFFQITPATFRLFTLIVNVILSPLICIFGVIANSIGLAVISKDRIKKQMKIYTYIFLLLVVDNLYLLLSFVMNILDCVEYFDFELGNLLNRHVWIYKGYILTWLKHVISALLVLMSLERLIALICPFSVKTLIISKYPKFITFLCALVFAAYLVPWSAGFRTVQFMNDQNKTVYRNIIKPSYKNTFLFYTYVETTILHYLFPVTVTVINVTTVVVYARYLRQRMPNFGKGQLNDNQLKITVTVLLTACLYIVLSLPYMIIQTLIFKDEDYSFYGRFKLHFFAFVFFGALLARINSAMDFLVYIVISKRYRGVLSVMMFRRRRKTSQSSVKTTSCKVFSTDVILNR